jgi:putative addiction module CopG family antidote
MPTENIKLTDHFSAFVRESVASGQFKDVSDVISAGLRLLEQQVEEDALRLKALQQIAEDAFSEIDRGEYRTYTVETIHELFDEIDEEIRTSSAD